MRQLLRFPDPVNELAARTVAAVVALLSLTILLTGWGALLLVLAYGFVARVLTGPTLSPLGQLATRVVAPRIGPTRPVPGPPKRFAQGIGAVLSVSAALLWYGFAAQTLALVLVGLVLVAATLEATMGLCVGCLVFAQLMRAGLVPASVCAACNDLSLRPGGRAADAAA